MKRAVPSLTMKMSAIFMMALMLFSSGLVTTDEVSAEEAIDVLSTLPPIPPYTIFGMVYGINGFPLPNASISITNVRTNETLISTTYENGAYRIIVDDLLKGYDIGDTIKITAYEDSNQVVNEHCIEHYGFGERVDVFFNESLLSPITKKTGADTLQLSINTEDEHLFSYPDEDTDRLPILTQINPIDSIEGDTIIIPSPVIEEIETTEIDIKLDDIRRPPYYRLAFTEKNNNIRMTLENSGDEKRNVIVDLYHVGPDGVNESFLKTVQFGAIQAGKTKTKDAYDENCNIMWVPTQTGRNWIRGEIYYKETGNERYFVDDFKESFNIVPGSRPVLSIQGDWYINEPTSILNHTIVVEGNVYVNAKLHLDYGTLVAGDLIINAEKTIGAKQDIDLAAAHDGEYKVEVNSPDGKLNVYGRLWNGPTLNGEICHYWFYMNGTLNVNTDPDIPGANPGIVENVMGSADLSQPGGIICTTDNVLIENGATVRYGKTHGVWLEGSDAVIRDANIHDNGGDGVVCIDGSKPTITGSDTQISWNGRNGILVSDSLPTIEGIRVQHNSANGITIKNSSQAYGIPDYSPGIDLGTFIWWDETGWNLAFSSDGNPHEFNGTITSNGDTTSFTRMVPGGEQRTMNIGDYEKAIIDIFLDGVRLPDIIFIGASSYSPKMLPVVLFSGTEIISNSKISYNHGSGIYLDTTNIEVANNEIWENGLTSIFSDDMSPYASSGEPDFTLTSSGGVRMKTRLATIDDITRMKEIHGVYEEGINYNQVIDGFGTGLVPPTEDEWESMIGTLTIVEEVYSDTMLSNSYVDNSLSPYFPPVGDQGQIGSCGSWATTYYTKTFQEAKERGWDLSGAGWTGVWTGPSEEYQDKIMSPYFTYNLINDGKDGGSSFPRGGSILQDIGVSSWKNMPPTYNTSYEYNYDPTSWPNETAWREAPLYRIADYSEIYIASETGIQELKDWLSAGNLAVISINSKEYPKLWNPFNIWTLDNYTNTSTNHANTIVGYDDNYGPYLEWGVVTYGAFRIVNSGGPFWGKDNDGKYWISYKTMEERIRSAWIFTDRIGYEPKLISIFNISHEYRSACQIEIGTGQTNIPQSTKSFVTYGGYIPFPENNIVLDVTELDYLKDMNMYLKFNGGIDDGTIKNFSAEYFEVYTPDTSSQREFSFSDDPPITYNSIDRNAVYAELDLSFTGIENWVATSMWHLVKNEPGAPEWNISRSGEWSWWFGNDVTGNYDDGLVSGNLTLATDVFIPSSELAYLSFWSWYETDTYGNDTDIRLVSITNGDDTIALQLSGEPMRTWVNYLVDISGLCGSSASIEFSFNSTNADNNNFQGWYVDDLDILGGLNPEGYGIEIIGESRSFIHDNIIHFNEGDGIRLSNARGVDMERNILVGHEKGMCLVSSNNNKILNNNDIQYNIYGFYCYFSDENTFSGNNLSSNHQGIYFLSSFNNSILNSQAIMNDLCGISLYSSGYNTIYNNNLLNNKYGIQLSSFSDENLITDNFASLNLEQGIGLSYSFDNEISDNHASQNGYGIYLSLSGQNNINNNTVISNHNDGIRLSNILSPTSNGNEYSIFSNYERNTITNNTICGNNYGISLYSSDNNNLENNNASNNNNGIYLSSSNDNIIEENSVTINNNAGIKLYKSNGIEINDNVVNMNRYGVYISTSSIAVLTNNTVSLNDDAGIYLDSSTRISISHNRMIKDGICIYGNSLKYWNTHIVDSTNSVNGKPVYYYPNQTSGIIPVDAGQVILVNCSGFAIEYQEISDCSVGILLGYSTGNEILSNVLASNRYGLYLFSSTNNKIFHNAFYDNINNAYVDNSYPNQWDDGYPSGGNYWGDFGVDSRCGPGQNLTDPDGISDIAYTEISGNSGSVDQYPLMYPHEGQKFTIILEPGWNLISIPTQEANWNVAAALASISGLYDEVQTYDSVTGTWKTYSTLSPPWLNTLKTLSSIKGYWIHITSTQPVIPLHLYGERISETTQVQLYNGWNLIGYPKMDWSRSVSTVMAGIPWDIVQIGDQTRPYNLRTMPGTYVMRPHRGYWLHVTEDCVWNT